MRLNTAEQLIDAIHDDRIWRLKEVSALKAAASSASRPLGERRAIARAGVALAYSHWEGFVKRSSERYLEHVSLQRITLEKLSPNFKVLYFRKLVGKTNGLSSFKSEQSAIEKLTSSGVGAPRLPYRDICQTFGNLGSSTFLVILDILGLDDACYKLELDYLDKHILKRRNLIAHGSSVAENSLASIDPDTFLEVGDRAISLLTLFSNQIENAAVSKQYEVLTPAAAI